jgi:predicted O-methyltransferase YrrM
MKDREFLTEAFQAALGRRPSTQDFEAYGELLRAGRWTRETVLWDLLHCEEYKQRNESDVREFVPAGHFYSAVPGYADREEAIRDEKPKILWQVDLRPKFQARLLKRLARYMEDCPFTPGPKPGLRYHYENPAYSYTDGYMLYAMLRLLRPQRVVEIGSGYSSALMLDVRERFVKELELLYIEPYTDLLKSLFKDGDARQVQICAQRVQDVDLSVFRNLRANDILFIDSTHVAKLGSDVNHLFFEVLPQLAKGVVIHIHDIFYPFEYPKPWIEEGRAWNEMYLLRAFLMHNRDYRVLLFNPFVHECCEEYMRTHLPMLQKNRGGSFWMQKLCQSAETKA